MVISLPPEMELLVKRQVENGRYASIEDVVFAGLSDILAQEDLLAPEMCQEQLK